MRKNHGDEIRVSSTNVPLRLAGFILALVVAVGAFSVGIASIGNKEPGYYEIEAPTAEEAPLYAEGIELTYYFTGSSNEIKAQITAVTEAYGAALLRAYKLLDPVNTYDGFANLAALSASPGQEITVGDELCTVLADAWERTQRGEGYDLFAGALVREWEAILASSDAQQLDPLADESMAQRIRALAEETAKPGQFALSAADGVVKVTIAEEYLDFLRENEYETAVLNTSVLREAYLLSLVRNALEAQGYTNGFLVTDGGLTLSLSGHETGAFCLYTMDDGEAVQAATNLVTANAACSLRRSFPLVEGEMMYYTLQLPDGVQIHRSPNSVFSAGEADTQVQSACVVRRDGDVVQAAYESALVMLGGAVDGGEAEVAFALWGGDGIFTNSDHFVPADGISTAPIAASGK